jgi:superfamily II helicase
LIWAEIRNDFEEVLESVGKRVIHIDAWETEDDNEEGKVIAKVIQSKSRNVYVEYMDERAKVDTLAQEVIEETIQKLKEEIA